MHKPDTISQDRGLVFLVNSFSAASKPANFDVEFIKQRLDELKAIEKKLRQELGYS